MWQSYDSYVECQKPSLRDSQIDRSLKRLSPCLIVPNNHSNLFKKQTQPNRATVKSLGIENYINVSLCGLSYLSNEQGGILGYH